MELIDQYTQFVNDISNNRNVKLNSSFTKEKLRLIDDDDIELYISTIFEDSKITMTIKDAVYFKLSSVSISWDSNLPEGGRILSGGFKINGITDALCFTDNFWRGAASLPLGAEIPEHLQHYNKLNWFERSADGTGGAYGCFIREPGKFPPPIAFYYRGWYKKLELSFEEYLTKMFESYAVSGWQFFHVDFPGDIKDFDLILDNMKAATEILPKIFPEKDWSFYLNKYNDTIAKFSK